MRQRRYRFIERTNRPGAGLSFALNKVRVVFSFGTSVSVELN